MDADLKILLQPKVNVYHRSQRQFGKVTEVRQDTQTITLNYGGTRSADLVEYDLDEFRKLLEDDIIVSKGRTYMDAQGNLSVKPRVKVAAPQETITVPSVELKPTTKADIESEIKESAKLYVEALKQDSNPEAYQIGYINSKSGNFSVEPKKGYVKIEYRPVVEIVTLRLTSDQLEKIKELGII